MDVKKKSLLEIKKLEIALVNDKNKLKKFNFINEFTYEKWQILKLEKDYSGASQYSAEDNNFSLSKDFSLNETSENLNNFIGIQII